MKPKAGDIAKGLEFGFKAAGVVVDRTARMVANNVVDIVLWTMISLAGTAAAGYILIKLDPRKVKYVYDLCELVSFANGRKDANDKIRKQLKGFSEKATALGRNIEGVKKRIGQPEIDMVFTRAPAT